MAKPQEDSKETQDQDVSKTKAATPTKTADKTSTETAKTADKDSPEEVKETSAADTIGAQSFTVTAKGCERRCRAGHCFGKEPTTLSTQDVTKKQFDQIADDPYLNVKPVQA